MFASVDFSTVRNPFFGFKFEVRGVKLSPTLILLVSFETIDRSNNLPCYAGHSYFPLFMDKVSELPITDPNLQVNDLYKLNFNRVSHYIRVYTRCQFFVKCQA